MAYYKGTLEELKHKVAQQLSEHRYQHCLRVAAYAKKLAEQNGVDPEKAEVAGLVHDYAKERSNEDFIKTIKEDKLDPELLNWGNAVWHGVVGAEMIRKELGITDPEILDAVRQHTTGAGANMSTLAKIVFMADYLETGRDFPGVEKAREITDRDLDDGVRYQIQHTMNYLTSKGAPIYPKSLDTYNYWMTH
ncbi:bis(5'-nucleosyl)-tetraphosphatase (symmetrical) YqeK [Eupransor demetentiae]|uniref:bis(5'-nucleosyl)-tetraphosphatase (symmetrical) n=1 Tax=Eupransor demetentiae TaxID=3109584 RepID=A0ABM9N601_9LACO|nr:Diadenosine tetraphosphatase YqeK or a related HD superfamily phosphohydrolase (YqeK) [Lactobacillaceae bacterium LMG 33000]